MGVNVESVNVAMCERVSRKDARRCTEALEVTQSIDLVYKQRN